MLQNQYFLNHQAHRELCALLSRTRGELDADLVMVISRAGQQVATAGSAERIDLTALASLAAACLAATDALAQVLGEPAFSALHHQGRGRGIHISYIGGSYTVVVIISRRLPPGMVRWKTQRAAAAMEKILLEREQEAGKARASPESADCSGGVRRITDDELDRLFSCWRPGRPCKDRVLS